MKVSLTEREIYLQTQQKQGKLTQANDNIKIDMKEMRDDVDCVRVGKNRIQ